MEEPVKLPVYYIEVNVCNIYVLYMFSLRQPAVHVAPLFSGILCRCIKYSDIFCFYCASCFCPVSFFVGWLPSLCFESSQTTHYSCRALPLTYRESGNSAHNSMWLLEVCISVQCPQLSLPVSEGLKLGQDTSVVLPLFISSLIFLITYCHCYSLHVL